MDGSHCIKTPVKYYDSLTTRVLECTSRSFRHISNTRGTPGRLKEVLLLMLVGIHHR